MNHNSHFSFTVSSLALAAALLLLAGCSSKPSDSQITTQVQSRIAADAALKGQPISIAVNNGKVTLSGTVGGEGSRELAANDASKVDGVHQIVNNLTVQSAPNAGTAATSGQPAPSESAPPPPVAEQSAQQTAPPPPPATAPVPPQAIVIPAGTRIRVQLAQTLSTKSSQTGDRFSGSVVSPVRVNGQTIIRAGARARGTVIEAKSQGRFKGKAVLAVRLESVSADGRSYPVRTSTVDRVEEGKGKRSAVMTGGGAGLGAIIGGLAGGGKGALIGGLVGGGGGAAGSAFTGNKDIVLPAETVLTFDLRKPVTIHR